MKDKEILFDINEIFYSIDGEGSTSGQLAIFIRFNGCNLRCSYCDTGYALKGKNNFISLDDLVKEIKKYKTKNITLTGGEPLLQDDLLELIKILPDYRFNIETNGTLDIENYLLENTIITMDIKTPLSKTRDQNRYSNIKKLRKNDNLKFVVGNKEDIKFAYKVIELYKPISNIYFSPIFNQITGDEIVEEIKKYGNDKIKLQLQIHKYIWSPDKRGV